MTGGLNKADCIRDLVAQRLRSVAASELARVPGGSHLDEDTIAAFVEGRLADAECKPVVSHLAACGLCRRTSAQFVQLENQIDDDASSTAAEEEPGRLEALLSRLGSAVPSFDDDAVFAYEERSDEAENGGESKSGNAPESPDRDS